MPSNRTTALEGPPKCRARLTAPHPKCTAYSRPLTAADLPYLPQNALVMNFLTTEGYAEAARTFQEESGTDRAAPAALPPAPPSDSLPTSKSHAYELILGSALCCFLNGLSFCSAVPKRLAHLKAQHWG